MQILEHGQEHERTEVSEFRHFESADSENHAGKTVPDGDSKKYSRMGAAFYGTDGSGNANHADPDTGSRQSRID